MTATHGRRAIVTSYDPAAVALDNEIYLVEASAGTGKTFALTLTVLRLLLDRNEAREYRVRGIGNILVVTFTNAATSELVTRVRAALRSAVDVFAGTVSETPENAHLFALCRQSRDDTHAIDRLRKALSEIDTLAIFTIHGFCKRVLDESALESGTPLDAGFIENDAPWIERVTQDWWRRSVYEESTLAALAVASTWSHDAFVKDMKAVERWPGTVVEPDESMTESIVAFRDAQRRFAAAWNHDHVRAFLAAQPWYSGAHLKNAAVQRAAVNAGDALAAGSLLGIAALDRCTTTALKHPTSGIKKSAKDNIEQIDREPFVAACDAIVASRDRVYRALRVSCLREVAREFDAEKTRRHQLDFDDLLRKLRDELEQTGSDGSLATAIRGRYDAALIDEFQDTDAYQFPIFSIAFAGRPLFLIGDPKQAIYAFRGADIFAYRAAAEAAGSAYTLDQNWRSTPRMVAAVNGLFGRRPNAFLYDWIEFRRVTAARTDEGPLASDRLGGLHWWYLPPEDAAAGGAKARGKDKAAARFHRAVVRECVRLLAAVEDDGQGIRAGSIAVLVRDSYEATDIHRALSDAGVPCILAKLGDILRSDEVHELEQILSAILKPQDGWLVRAALATELWGKGASEIHALSIPDGEQEWQSLIDELVALRETWLRRGFLRMMESFVADHGVVERLLARADGERRVTNLRQAIELLHALSLEERLSPEGLILRIARARVMKTEDAARTELRLESDADAVQIVTVHSSKGLEYDVVFCPGLWACKRPSADDPVLVHENNRTVVFDHGSPKRAERGRLAEAERLAEDLRLVYVALTRARYRCYVGWGPIKNAKSGAASWHTGLGYLLRPDGIDGDEATVTERTAAAMEQSLDTWEQRLRELVDTSNGAMSWEILGSVDEPISRRSEVPASVSMPMARAELPSSQQLDSWRIASFTSLSASQHGASYHGPERHVQDGRDVSDTSSERVSEPGTIAPTHGRDDFLAFPVGRTTGIVLHELFEKVDFNAPESDIRALTIEILERERLIDDADDQRVTGVSTMAARVLESTLPDVHFALRDVPRVVTLREWTFDLPLGVVARDTLAHLFKEKGGDVARRYASTLERIAPDRTHGFLIGVIDLAFMHEGKWYVVDWKSNHLGNDSAQYESAALEREMFTSQYVLQYHLYVTALHRYLRTRIPGYTYETHMGGVYYAFLRGIDGTRRGWFVDRPAESLVDALDTLMSSALAAAEPMVVA